MRPGLLVISLRLLLRQLHPPNHDSRTIPLSMVPDQDAGADAMDLDAHLAHLDLESVLCRRRWQRRMGGAHVWWEETRAAESAPVDVRSRRSDGVGDVRLLGKIFTVVDSVLSAVRRLL